MIQHIVLWRFLPEAEGRTKAENMAYIKERLLALPAIIPELKSMTIGEDCLHSSMSYDMALLTTFSSMEDLKVYKEHPAHRAVSAYVAKVRTDRATCDIEL